MKKLLVFAFVAVLIAGVSSVSAAGVDVAFPKGMVTAYTTETQSMDFTVKNLQEKEDTFTLSLFPTQFEKITAGLDSFLIKLASGEEKIVRLTFSIPIDATPQSTQFEITAKSTSDASVSDTKNFILNVQRLTPLYIQLLSLGRYTANPGDEIGISARVFNLDDAKSEKYILKIIVVKGTATVKTFEESLDSIGAKSSVDISKTLVLDRYASPGSYVVDAELRSGSNQLMHSKSLNFNVNTVTQPNTEYTYRSSRYNILFSKVTISVVNEGNVDMLPFTVTQSIPKFAQSLFDPDVEPLTTDSSGNRIIYTWSVPQLAPGGQYTITYNIAIWRLLLTLGIVTGIGYGAYRWLAKPRIGKLTRHEGEITKGKDIIVMLEVKNRAMHEIKDVEVIDIVPQIARVVDRFDTLRPSAKRVAGGIQLKWNLSSMKAGEERILTYRIRPIVDVIGHLNLPQAQMIYLSRNKVRKASASKQTLVKAEIGQQ